MSKQSVMKNKKLSPTILRLLCGEYLSSITNSNAFLCHSGLVYFTSGPQITKELFGLHFEAEITGINIEAYNALGITNLPLQMAACFWLDRIGLLYRGGPRMILDRQGIKKRKGKKQEGPKYHHNVASTPVVNLPDEFRPERKFDYRRHIKFESITRSCKIEIPSKFDPSILVLDEQQYCKVLHSALQKLDTKLLYLRDTKLLYLRDERVRAIKLSESKQNRKNAVIQKYFENSQKHVSSLECDARDAEMNVLRTRETILASKKRLEETVAEKCEQEIPELESIAKAFRSEATSLRKEMGSTIESFDRYLDIVEQQKEHQNIELCRLKFLLSDFEKNNDSIQQLDELIKNVDSNLEKIKKVVEKNYRLKCMSASFDISSKIVTLYLGSNTHDIELSHYLHHLKERTRKSDIKRIEEYIGEICSNLTGWIASLSRLDPRVEQDLSKIRDTVKLYWRASFDVSTKKVCLIHPTDKVEHLDIPKYVEYLRGKIRHFEEILTEKKRMCQ